MISKSKEEYDSVPVVFCENCLSLNIISDCGIDYCKDCGSTEINDTDIYIWRERYKRKFGKEFINNK